MKHKIKHFLHSFEKEILSGLGVLRFYKKHPKIVLSIAVSVFLVVQKKHTAFAHGANVKFDIFLQPD